MEFCHCGKVGTLDPVKAVAAVNFSVKNLRFQRMQSLTNLTLKLYSEVIMKPRKFGFKPRGNLRYLYLCNVYFCSGKLKLFLPQTKCTLSMKFN